MAENKKNLFQRMLAIMDDVPYLQKDDSVSTGQGKSYKAITEEKVTTAIRAAMIKHGVVIYPESQDYDRTDLTLVDKNGNERISRLATVATKYRVVNVDDPTDYIIAVSNGEGADTQDKGVGKAMTYAYKYLLLRMFAIPTGEDPDKISSEEYTEKLEMDRMLESKITKQQAKNLHDFIIARGRDVNYVLEYHNVGRLEDLTGRQYGQIIKWLK